MSPRTWVFPDLPSGCRRRADGVLFRIKPIDPIKISCRSCGMPYSPAATDAACTYCGGEVKRNG